MWVRKAEAFVLRSLLHMVMGFLGGLSGSGPRCPGGLRSFHRTIPWPNAGLVLAGGLTGVSSGSQPWNGHFSCR